MLEGVRDRLKFVPGKWEFKKCRGCGSAVLFPQPKAADLASYYPPVYDFSIDFSGAFFKRLWTNLEYRFFFQPQYHGLARQILHGTGGQNLPRQHLLDVGTGLGLPLFFLRKYGYKVCGTDFRPEVVEYLEKQLAIPSVCTDAASLARHFPPASFDVVTAFHVLEHVADVQTVIRNCFELLRPGGWFVNTIPLADSLQARLFRNRWAAASEAPRHLSIPSREGITSICKNVGFDRLKIQPCTVLDCAGVFVLSVLPSIGTRHLRKTHPISALLIALAAVSVGMIAVPWCLAENYLLGKPCMGTVFAHKPE